MKYPNIEAERARLGMSKKNFSKELGIATKTYYNWLDGTNPIPSDVLIKLANMCKVKTDYLLGLDEDAATGEKLRASDGSAVTKATG